MCVSVSMCVCLCVCLSASLSPEPHARSLRNFLCMLPIAVARSSSGMVKKSYGNGVILGVFYPSIAFGTHTKSAEPIEILFGLVSREDHRYHVVDGGPDPLREGAFLGGGA